VLPRCRCCCCGNIVQKCHPHDTLRGLDWVWRRCCCHRCFFVASCLLLLLREVSCILWQLAFRCGQASCSYASAIHCWCDVHPFPLCCFPLCCCALLPLLLLHDLGYVCTASTIMKQNCKKQCSCCSCCCIQLHCMPPAQRAL